MNEESKPTGPDFSQGCRSRLSPKTAWGGVRYRRRMHALSRPARPGAARRRHYPLPRHHARFSLRTGEALRSPALDPVVCWRVEQRDGTVIVHDGLAPAKGVAPAPSPASPESIVIGGGGAAGQAAAEMLRREGYAGPVTILSAEDERPYDRPNLSKDYLAGTAPADWLPLRLPEFYAAHEIALALGARAVAIDAPGRKVQLADGARHPWGALLLATGAEPNRFGIPGSRTPARPHSAQRQRLPRIDRRGAGRVARGRGRRQLYRARSCGVAAGHAGSTSMSWRPRRARWKLYSGPRSAS